ncbi:MAG TPA: outer membrane protein assembly factor BamD [Candidatus Krumholzibacteria bacterium]|nr:outer membrane protein assembly factor BamD [Candidatus Krumholzibacteria bacterium]
MTNALTAPARTALAAAAAAALLLVVGCGMHNPYPVGSFERGAFYAERGNNVEAVAALESFVRHNPTDSLAAEAQYLKAMTYMDMGEFPLAAVEFQILRKDYPTSERVEDAYFQEGLAYFDQVGRIERDMTGAYDARNHFLRFLESYPRSAHVPEVHAKLQEISDLLVQKRLDQVKVFRQLHRHQAVGVVLDDVLASEPGSSLIDEVLWQRAKNAEKLEDADTARSMYERIVANHPESPYAKRAAEALRRAAAADEG